MAEASSVISPATKKRKLDNDNDDDYLHCTNITTIYSAQKELVKAKKGVKELENLIKNLQEKEGKEKRLKQSTTIESNCSKALQGQTLISTLEFLQPRDVLSCVQVCRRWNHEIDSNPRVWKKAAENRSPDFAKVMTNKIEGYIKAKEVEAEKEKETEEKKRENESSSKTPVTTSSDLAHHFKNIAKGLVYEPSQKSTESEEEEEAVNEEEDLENLHKHVAPEDVYFLVEIKDKKSGEVIGSFYKSLIRLVTKDGFEDAMAFELLSERSGSEVVLPATLKEGAFEDHFEDGDADPNEDVPQSIHDGIMTSLRCFRCDTGQSCCWILEGQRNDQVNYDHNRGRGSEGAGLEGYTRRPDASTEAGVRARDLWSLLGYSGMSLTLFYVIEQFFPPSNNSTTEQSDHDRWRQLRYKVNYMTCTFDIDRIGERVGKYDWNMREFIISLAGMAWL